MKIGKISARSWMIVVGSNFLYYYSSVFCSEFARGHNTYFLVHICTDADFLYSDRGGKGGEGVHGGADRAGGDDINGDTETCGCTQS